MAPHHTEHDPNKEETDDEEGESEQEGEDSDEEEEPQSTLKRKQSPLQLTPYSPKKPRTYPIQTIDLTLED